MSARASECFVSADVVVQTIDQFESRERGLPQAHIAAKLVAEMRAMLAAVPKPAEPPRTLLEQYDLDQCPNYRKGREDGRLYGYEVGKHHAAEALQLAFMPVDWEPLDENPIERRSFDRQVECWGSVQAAITTYLKLWGDMSAGGSYGAQCHIMANEVAKLSVTLNPQPQQGSETEPVAIEWPQNGQDFTIYVAGVGEGDTFDLRIVQAPHLVKGVCSNTYGDRVTDDLFFGEVPTEQGLWKLQIKFVLDPQQEEDTGARWDDIGFEVLSKEKL